MKTTNGYFRVGLLTALFVVVRASSDYIQMSVIDGDLARFMGTKTDGYARRSVVKRASLDEQSRPSVVEETLNSLRSQQHAANMYYVVRSQWLLISTA